MGGGFCLLLAPRGVFDAVAPNYGVLTRRFALPAAAELLPGGGQLWRQGLDAARRGGAGGTVLTEGGVPHDVKEYPGVGHSFMNDFGMPAPLRMVEGIAGVAYSAPEAEDAWQRIMTFFAQHLA